MMGSSGDGNGFDIRVMPKSTGEDAILTAVLENGRKVYRPPIESGLRPPLSCELFLKNLPNQLDEQLLLRSLQRYGRVHEFRLMMNSSRFHRGYGFVRFTSESVALAALELLNFLFMDGERISAARSLRKKKFYINNIPRSLSAKEIEQGFRQIFSHIQKVTVPSSQKQNIIPKFNCGFAFVEFEDHEIAMNAKKLVKPGPLRMWNTDLRVQWALSPPMEKPLRHFNDFCAKLRLYCIANNWCVPIVVYGRSLRPLDVQYGGILLHDYTSGKSISMLMEIAVTRVYEIHEVMCEVATAIIKLNSGFPKQNYIARVLHASRADLIYQYENSFQQDDFQSYLICSKAIEELAKSLQLLSQFQSEYILLMYKKSFLTTTVTPFPVMNLGGVEQFYAIYPKFRDTSPLGNNLNNTEIILMLKYDETVIISTTAKIEASPHATSINLLHNSYRNSLYRLQYVDIVIRQLSDRWFYHPSQRINSHPIWIKVHSYQQSIFEDPQPSLLPLPPLPCYLAALNIN